jgi:hypothetical protein
VVARSERRVRQPTAHRGPDLTDARRTVIQGDRRKAYRPISADLRHTALQEGLAAYERGDFFQAHELLEPAWMGTDDLAERALYQGLIKIAAGYVHAVRGNPIGLARNLRGAREHLATSLRLNPEVAVGAEIDLIALLARLDARLADIMALAAQPAVAGVLLIDLVPKAPQIR